MGRGFRIKWCVHLHKRAGRPRLLHPLPHQLLPFRPFVLFLPWPTTPCGPPPDAAPWPVYGGEKGAVSGDAAPKVPGPSRSLPLLTLAVVVRMRSCSIKDVTMLRSMAQRWEDVRPSLRYGMVLATYGKDWRRLCAVRRVGMGGGQRGRRSNQWSWWIPMGQGAADPTRGSCHPNQNSAWPCLHGAVLQEERGGGGGACVWWTGQKRGRASAIHPQAITHHSTR